PISIIVAVLGSIFAGMATPTEAASVGALGTIISAAVYRKLTWGRLKLSLYSTLRLTAMLMWIMTGALVFTAVYTGLGAPQLISDTIEAFRINRWFIIIGMQVTFLILGMIMEPNGIMMITIPIYAPLVVALGFDPIWFGILIIMNIECAFLTPPFGWNIFYLKSIAPEGITLIDIYRSVVPFVALQILGLITVMVVPQIALLLPNLIIGVR
ncbi:unnamed protein product, partial [marine sediment metagenome]